MALSVPARFFLFVSILIPAVIVQLASDINPSLINLPPLRPLPGDSATALDGLVGPIERLFEGGIFGPESLLGCEDGTLLTGLADGRIVRLFPGGNGTDGSPSPRFEVVARTGRDDPG